MTDHQPPVFASVDTDEPCSFCDSATDSRTYCEECDVTHCGSSGCQLQHWETCQDAVYQALEDREAGHIGIGLLIILAVLAIVCGYSVTGHLRAAVVVIVGFVALALMWVLQRDQT